MAAGLWIVGIPTAGAFTYPTGQKLHPLRKSGDLAQVAGDHAFVNGRDGDQSQFSWSGQQCV